MGKNQSLLKAKLQDDLKGGKWGSKQKGVRITGNSSNMSENVLQTTGTQYKSAVFLQWVKSGSPLSQWAWKCKLILTWLTCLFNMTAFAWDPLCSSIIFMCEEIPWIDGLQHCKTTSACPVGYGKPKETRTNMNQQLGITHPPSTSIHTILGKYANNCTNPQYELPGWHLFCGLSKFWLRISPLLWASRQRQLYNI